MRSKPRILLMIAAIGLATLAAFPGCKTAPPPVAPVDYSSLMRDVGERYKDLYVAAKQDKWEFAEFQAKKIRVLIDRGAAIHPATAGDTNDFIIGAYPAIVKVTQSKDTEEFDKEYGRFASYCNTCHAAQNVGYLSLSIPTVSDSPILDAGQISVSGDGKTDGGSTGEGPSAEEAEALVGQKCTVCHDLARVEAAAYSGSQWNDLINRMMDKGAPVEDDEVEDIASYLDSAYGG